MYFAIISKKSYCFVIVLQDSNLICIHLSRYVDMNPVEPHFAFHICYLHHCLHMHHLILFISSLCRSHVMMFRRMDDPDKRKRGVCRAPTAVSRALPSSTLLSPLLSLGFFFCCSCLVRTAQAAEASKNDDGGVYGFIISILTNVGIGSAVLVAFVFFREKFPGVYAPRCREKLQLHAPQSDDFSRPDAPATGYIGWIKSTWRCSDADLFKTAGLDALMFVKFYTFGFQLFALCGVLGVCVLLPLNVTDFAKEMVEDEVNGVKVEIEQGFKGLDLLTLSNVTQGSVRLWAHVVTAYAFAFIAYALLWRLFSQYSVFRTQHMHAQAHASVSQTVLVQNIPKEASTLDKVAAFFRQSYADTFLTAAMVGDVETKLLKLLQKRKEVVDKLEHACGVVQEKLHSEKKCEEGEEIRPKHKVGMLCGSKVDSIEEYEKNLDALNDEVKEMQKKAPAVLPAAFVTFSSTYSAIACCHFDHGDQPFGWQCKLAPEPRDVFWTNLHHSRYSRLIRQTLVACAVFMLVFFWMIPVGFVATLSTLDQLAKQFPFLDFVTDLSPGLKGFLQGFLPTLVLLVFNIVLPKILLVMSVIEGIEAVSWLQMAVLRKLFYFQLLNNFLILTISSALFVQLQAIVDSPTSIAALLGAALPKASTFFINYIMLNTFSVFPMKLLTVGPLVVGFLKKKFLAKTPKELLLAEVPPLIDYAVTYSPALLVFIIGYCYASLAPLVLVFATFYFGLGFFVAKYQALYVIVNGYESGGLFWPIVFSRVCIGLIVGQLTLLGALGLKQVPAQASALLPLPFLSFYFYRYALQAFEHRSFYMTVEECHEVDLPFLAAAKKDDALETGNALPTTLGTTAYVQKEITDTAPVQADLSFLTSTDYVAILRNQPPADYARKLASDVEKEKKKEKKMGTEDDGKAEDVTRRGSVPLADGNVHLLPSPPPPTCSYRSMEDDGKAGVANSKAILNAQVGDAYMQLDDAAVLAEEVEREEELSKASAASVSSQSTSSSE